jgi:hypothetical protein
MTARKVCGGKTRAGGKCGRPKGWGTDHAGHGRCKFHGGASPSGRKAAGRERALEFARGMLGASVAGSPLDAMQESVDLARGLVSFYRHELADAAAQMGTKDAAVALRRIEELREPYADAIKLERDVAKAAIDAHLGERRQRLAEREAELLAGAIADGLQEAFGDLATSERRATFAKVVRRRLLLLEAQEGPPVVEGRGRALPAAA